MPAEVGAFPAEVCHPGGAGAPDDQAGADAERSMVRYQ
jgi:hypothetical protein